MFELKPALHMIYLCGCALSEIEPDELKIKTMDFVAIYEIAKFHSIQVCVYEVLKNSVYFSANCPENLRRIWSEDTKKATYRDVMFDIEREKIISYLENKGIWYLPLKGILLKKYYPSSAMRFMADNDILYDTDYQEDLHDAMLAMGYNVESYKTGHEDAYHKKPFFNFEMHTMLFDKVYGCSMVSYYDDVKSRLIKDEDNKCGYHFSEEDFYVYFLAHAYKHYEEYGGNGIRFLMDCFLYLRKMEKKLDWEYIYGELDQLGICEFGMECKELAFLLFENPREFDLEKLEERQKNRLIYLLQSGTYGIEAHSIQNRMKMQGENTTKIKYLLRRVFPEMDWYETFHPYIFRHKWLIPFFLVWRFFRGVFTKMGKIIRELKTIKKL